ncbi:MAG TPA: hypothetical protein VES88_13815 [Gemmatimonadaceae bacterium]|nr:hypothetical protein [Gemmatimonadaceae bacterium]
MRKVFSLSMVLGMVLCAPVLGAQAGSPNTTPGTVSRVTLLRITPGHGNMFWQDVRQHSLPIWEEQKRKGLITNYSVSTKTTTEDPADWNVAFVLTYKNWGTLDSFGARNDSLTRAHYGSAEARTAAGLARIAHATVVSSLLVRDQTVNPWR